LVADLGGRTESGFFGGLLATAARASGIEAAVIDGAVRDCDELSRLGFPTFCVGLNAADSYARDEAIAFDVVIEVGNVPVAPGDFLLGDADGIVVVPSSRGTEVFEAARQKVARENGMRSALLTGMPIDEAFRTFKVL
jgi:regulator of RNase E activity RraA